MVPREPRMVDTHPLRPLAAASASGSGGVIVIFGAGGQVGQELTELCA